MLSKLEPRRSGTRVAVIGCAAVLGMLFLNACGSLGKSKAAKAEEANAKAEAARQEEMRKPVGVVDSVTSRKYVLVRMHVKGMASGKPELEVWRGQEKIGKLKLSGEEKDSWVAADILEGEPRRGDEVRRSGMAPSANPASPVSGSVDGGLPPDPYSLPELLPPPPLDANGAPIITERPAETGAESGGTSPGAMPQPQMQFIQPQADEAPPPLPDWAKPTWQDDTH